MQPLHFPLNRRRGFTLVELLVVMALIVLLAALMIGFFPSVTTSAREARGAVLLQSWLNIAKQRALRDQTPIGLRLVLDPTASSLLVSDCQYILQPDDYCVGKVYTLPGINNKVLFTVPGLDNGYGLTPDQIQYWIVQPSDYLEVNGSGLMYRVQTVESSDGMKVDQISVTPSLPNQIGSVPLSNPLLGPSSPAPFRIVRGSRALGDEPLKMPDNTFIDLQTNDIFGNQLPYTRDLANTPLYVDILFAPSGQLISRGLTTDKIHLWVRAPSIDGPKDNSQFFKGDPTLVSIFARTGFVGAYPPDPASGNPYSFVK